MIYGVFGPRDAAPNVEFTDYAFVAKVLSTFSDIDGIIVGGAKGVETLAERWARENNKLKECIRPVEIRTFGMQQAFRLRNTKIIDASHRIIMFWDGNPNGPLLTALAEATILMRETTIIPMPRPELPPT